jgi:hypothetical protein
MRSLLKFSLVGIMLLSLAAFVAGTIWFQRDRTAMLATLCEAGLPNFSRPRVVDADRLGCDILSTRRRVSGVLLTGFEASNLIENDLPASPEGGDFTGGATWFECNQVTGCDEKLGRQLRPRIPGVCAGLARITGYGWVTETPGNYGHLGGYAREFYVDEVVDVGPPPPALVARMRREEAEAGFGECPRLRGNRARSGSTHPSRAAFENSSSGE